MGNPFKQQSDPSVDITQRELILRQPTREASHSTRLWLAACLESSQSASCSEQTHRKCTAPHGRVGYLRPGGTACDVSIATVRGLKILPDWGRSEAHAVLRRDGRDDSTRNASISICCADSPQLNLIHWMNDSHIICKRQEDLMECIKTQDRRCPQPWRVPAH